jgi:hypothetical protein
MNHVTTGVNMFMIHSVTKHDVYNIMRREMDPVAGDLSFLKSCFVIVVSSRKATDAPATKPAHENRSNLLEKDKSEDNRPGQPRKNNVVC